MERIDVHQHLIPPVYREALAAHGIAAAGGRELPEWDPTAARQMMAEAGIGSAILSISTPGTSFLADPAEAIGLARAANDYTAGVTMEDPDHFGFFATLPLPDTRAATNEAVRALDTLAADGVVLLGNSGGEYLGHENQDALFRALDERAAIAFVHPADLPGPVVPGVLPFAADFLLDTSRAAYLLVRNGVRQRYPNIRFILSHGGGFVPYAAHRMALAIFTQTGRSPIEVIEEFASFYFDTALSSSAAALPTLLGFADPGHVLYGSDWPFAPEPAVHYFNAGLDEYPGCDDATRTAIHRTNATALFARFGEIPPASPNPSLLTRARRDVRGRVFSAVARAASNRR
ncbi:amidohydrolase family protein [Nocardia aurea]|uniref:amidohydrolase family protein n=1 Tax=Nocardia aurea TaxID=2144174 RepID=UPI000D685BDA|nr:amidohydrolase family protein [Nocardia aurea]